VLVRLDAAALVRWAAVARSSFAESRAEIDALNVFPVPDGDTGTNLYLTLDGAIAAARTMLERRGDELPPLADLLRAMSSSMLLTARGNSGVILSQLFRGFAESVVEAREEAIDGAGLAAAFAHADRLAWRAVTEPKEGTILSVTRATAAACRELVSDRPDATLVEVVTAAVQASDRALAATPTQLAALARAGVVDAGGAGFVLLVEALARVVHGQLQPTADPMAVRHSWARAGGPALAHPPAAPEEARDETTPGSPAYEVMFLLADSDDDRVAALTARLAELGDSLLVVGADGLWNVHVHVDDVGAAIEAGIEAGRPHRIAVTHFGDQIAAAGGAAPPAHDPDALAVVACAAGEGLADTFRDAGARVVLSGPGRRAAAGELLAAVRASHAGRVLVLPNDSDTLMAARAAAEAAVESGLQVRVVDSRTAVQGLAALAVLDPDADLDANGSAMSAAAAATRHGAVTVAHKQADTAAGVCRVGDVLGAVAGEFVVIGDDLAAVAADVVTRLLGEDGELLTVVTGADAPAGLAESTVAAARALAPDLEVVLLDGGQPIYPLLLGVE